MLSAAIESPATVITSPLTSISTLAGTLIVRLALAPFTVSWPSTLLTWTPAGSFTGILATRDMVLFPSETMQSTSPPRKIGRASLRERVGQYGKITVVAEYIKKKTKQ